MLNTEKLFTKLEFAYIMNYYRLKVACSKQRYADVICLNHSHSGAVFFSFPVYFYDISIFSAIINVIFQLPLDIFINNISLYHILHNYLL